MHTDIIVALIEIAPSALVTLGVIIIALVFRKQIKETILPRLGTLKILGVEIGLLKNTLDEVASKRDDISEEDKWSPLKRAQHIKPVIEGAMILWVDDTPQMNSLLIKILNSLGSEVTIARNSDEALKLLHRHQFHVVVSDINRKEGKKAGLDMVKRMVQENVYKWTIFYVLNLEPGVPEHAFNITNRPDHLLHFIMDVLERDRWET